MGKLIVVLFSIFLLVLITNPLVLIPVGFTDILNPADKQRYQIKQPNRTSENIEEFKLLQSPPPVSEEQLGPIVTVGQARHKASFPVLVPTKLPRNITLQRVRMEPPYNNVFSFYSEGFRISESKGSNKTIYEQRARNDIGLQPFSYKGAEGWGEDPSVKIVQGRPTRYPGQLRFWLGNDIGYTLSGNLTFAELKEIAISMLEPLVCEICEQSLLPIQWDFTGPFSPKGFASITTRQGDPLNTYEFTLSGDDFASLSLTINPSRLASVSRFPMKMYLVADGKAVSGDGRIDYNSTPEGVSISVYPPDSFLDFNSQVNIMITLKAESSAPERLYAIRLLNIGEAQELAFYLRIHREQPPPANEPVTLAVNDTMTPIVVIIAVIGVLIIAVLYRRRKKV